jgi:hypothetical protein
MPDTKVLADLLGEEGTDFHGQSGPTIPVSFILIPSGSSLFRRSMCSATPSSGSPFSPLLPESLDNCGLPRRSCRNAVQQDITADAVPELNRFSPVT